MKNFIKKYKGRFIALIGAIALFGAIGSQAFAADFGTSPEGCKYKSEVQYLVLSDDETLQADENDCAKIKRATFKLAQAVKSDLADAIANHNWLIAHK